MGSPNNTNCVPVSSEVLAISRKELWTYHETVDVAVLVNAIDERRARTGGRWIPNNRCLRKLVKVVRSQ